MKTITNIKKGFFLAICCFFSLSILAQKIVYSDPDREDTRRINFEVIGKINGKYLVYKNMNNHNWIVSYDDNMDQVKKTEQDYMPQDKLINVDFLPYQDFFFMIYQFQRKNVIYCYGVRVNEEGKKITEPVELDSSHISALGNNKVYNIISSEDKKMVMLFKINSKNKEKFIITTMLFNTDPQLIKKSVITLPMEERNEYLDEFQLDDQGDLVFTKFYRQSSDVISRAQMVVKYANSDSFLFNDLKIDERYLDEIHIKVDNFNNRFLLTSFYYKEKKGNIEGFYFYSWDKLTRTKQMENIVSFGDDLRKDAKGESSLKMAFNDYFIRNIIIRKDGGFLISTESYYTSSRYNGWSRWDYLYGSPYYYSPTDYYSYGPYGNSAWNRSRYYNSGQSMRYHADNIVIISFDKNGTLQWNDVISKEQYDDDSDDLISYQIMNTGGQLHFMFNVEEKKGNLLNDYVLTGTGKVNHNPTLKNLDRGFDFMAKYGKQVSSFQMIIPCLYRNNICFAKIDFN
jgi:hypothetical protein